MENTKLDYLAKKIAEEIMQKREIQESLNDGVQVEYEEKGGGVDYLNWTLWGLCAVVLVFNIIDRWRFVAIYY